MVFNPMGIVVIYLQRDGEEVSCEAVKLWSSELETWTEYQHRRN